MAKKRIAVHIQSEVQWFSVAPLLEALKKSQYKIVVLIDGHEGDAEGAGMALDMRSFLRKNGYGAVFFSECIDDCFDLMIAPYIDGKVNARCYLKYEYGTLNVKPNLTYTPHFMDRFDGFLCQSTVTANLLSAYGKTFLVDNLRFCGMKKKNFSPAKKKKTVLFAPTFNDSLTEDDLGKIIDNLKSKYRVIVKGHHGTEYLVCNREKKDILVQKADKYYGPKTNLSELIVDADVCLFGNSSAVGEALYAGVPCLVFAEDLNLFSYGELQTTLSEFAADGDLLVCKDLGMIEKMIEEAMSIAYRDRQKRLSQRIFPLSARDGVKGYLEVIDAFMNDRDTRDYLILHRYMINEKYYDLGYYKNELKEAEEKCKKMVEYKEMLDDYRKRKLYRLADKIYRLEGMIKNEKN